MDTMICVAAGLSSRMGACKPLLPLGNSTIIRMPIARYRACDIEQIILVTGRDADILEEHVSDLGVRCCRNEEFATSDMLCSVKIGIRAYLTDCAEPQTNDRILLTPCDIPLVRASTVEALLDAPGGIRMPTTDGQTGHPLCLPHQVLERVLSYEGPCGLQGALRALDAETTLVPVDDPGILLNADTPDDYERLKQLYQARYA